MPFHKATITLLLGFAVRECFSFWTGHPSDFELWVRLGYAMNHGGNPYGVLPFVPGLSYANVFSVGNTATIAYLPFWPLVTGLMYALYAATGIQNRFLYYFLLKQPPIIGDVVVGYLLYSYVSSRATSSAGFWALSTWLLSPFTILISSVWGMFDSIAIALMLASIMTCSGLKRPIWISLAVFAKSIPIIYAAPLTLRRHTRPTDLIAFAVAVALPVTFSVATFMAMNWPFSVASATLGSTIAKGGGSMSIWDILYFLNYLGLFVLQPATYAALGLVWIPAVVILTVVGIRRFAGKSDPELVQILLVCTLVFLVFKAQITEQYALYFFALATIDIALWHPGRGRMLFASIAVATIYLIVNNYFLVRFLSPVYPGFVSFEEVVQVQFGLTRSVIDLLLGTAFTSLNLRYLTAVWKRQNL